MVYIPYIIKIHMHPLTEEKEKEKGKGYHMHLKSCLFLQDEKLMSQQYIGRKK